MEYSMNLRYVDPDTLEQEADELITGKPQAPVGDEPTETPPAADEPPDEPAAPASGAADEPPQVDEPPDEPTDGEPPLDDLKGLTLKNAQERIRNAQARMTKATTEAATLRKQLEAVNPDRERLEGQVRTLTQRVKELETAAATATPAAPAPVTDSALAKLQEEYPDLAPVIQELSASRVSLTRLDRLEATNAELRTRLDETSTRVDQRSEREKIAEHFAFIRGKHPDFDKIVGSDDFKGWQERQPPLIQQALNKGTAPDVVWAIDLYKQAVGITKQRKGRVGVLVDPAVQPAQQPTAGNHKPTFTRKQIDAMSAEEYAANEAAIDLAMAEGRIT